MRKRMQGGCNVKREISREKTHVCIEICLYKGIDRDLKSEAITVKDIEKIITSHDVLLKI